QRDDRIPIPGDDEGGLMDVFERDAPETFPTQHLEKTEDSRAQALDKKIAATDICVLLGVCAPHVESPPGESAVIVGMGKKAAAAQIENLFTQSYPQVPWQFVKARGRAHENKVPNHIRTSQRNH